MAEFGFLVNTTSNHSMKSRNESRPRMGPPPFWLLEIPKQERIAFLCAYSMILLLSLVGNCTIMAIVYKNYRMRTTANYLLANMAATDVAAVLSAVARALNILVNSSIEFEVPGTLGNALCKIAPFVKDVSTTVSIESMVVIGFDRLFAVVFPMRCTPRMLDLRVTLPIIWVTAVLAFSIYFYILKLVTTSTGVYICTVQWTPAFDPEVVPAVFSLSIFTLFFVSPLVIVSVVYTITAVKLKQQTIPGIQSSESEQRQRKRNRSVTMMAVAIVASFFMCWTPYHILNITDMFVWKGRPPPHVLPYIGLIFRIVVLLSYTSFAINPYLCFIFSGNYRKCFRELFPFSLCCTTRVGPLDVSTRVTVANTGNRNVPRQDKPVACLQDNEAFALTAVRERELIE